MFPLILLLISSVTLGHDEYKPYDEYEYIYKCCRKGEELHSNGRDCVKRPGHDIQIMEEDEGEEVGNPVELKFQTLYWLPLSVLNQLPDKQLYVMYRNKNFCYSQYFLLLNTNNTDRYTIMGNYSLNVSFTYLNGVAFNVELQNFLYCLDSISGSRGPHVFRMCIYEMVNVITPIRKCCNFGQRIRLRNTKATCEDYKNSTWSVHNSIFRSHLPGKITTDVMDGSKFLCSTGEFKTLLPSDAFEFIKEHLGKVLYNAEQLSITNYDCFDLFSDEFAENETIGFCYHTSKTAEAYILVFRHFPVPAALALAVGLTILGIRPNVSKTLHGKALICHIFSLCVGNVLHAVWEYKIMEHGSCRNTALLVLNFFMMSSVLWLSAICFNMARGFGAPLDVRTKINSWRVFAWYSLFVWGGSLLHTVLLVTQPWKKYSDRNVMAYLYHTRTCFSAQDWRHSPNLEVMFFGYGPASILLIVNVCFLTSTILKIRKMQRNTSILQRRLSIYITNNESHKTSLKYVRLLLTTGVGEMAAEMAALGLRVPTALNADGSRLMDDDIWAVGLASTECLFRSLAALCDLLRALCLLALCCSGGDALRRLREGARALWRTACKWCGTKEADAGVEMNVYSVNR